MGRVIDNPGLMGALENRAAGRDAPPETGGAGPQVPCPNCGRRLRIPPGRGTVGLGCKSCLHCYRYDYANGSMTPLGHIEPPPGHPLAAGKTGTAIRHSGHWRYAALAAVILACALLGFLFYIYTLPPPDPGEAAPRAALEEIQRQLKSLAD